ncbi:hypothetical protein L198_05541 [Cryptococcus wingfieldii CBS 7118]|uniref:Cyclopropane-fatty-acyl-phospholipid synthase n=1 Tax=Cryptococcus wingfieldii CBS 7118 TaxID=1295528 RepID=A0A1E3IVX2_9TREE|nr:hypothetical protein L198_05541 [Cryptococcus wingfieldii CBS 7118]ODN92747.1 hypothetical protein L198_05541 [Cryptococcus wingfieldii CBS 7118]
MSSPILLLVIAAIPLFAGYIYLTTPTKKQPPNALPSFFFPAVTYHGRQIPSSARNAFSIPVLCLCADIEALQDGALDLPLRVLHHGGDPKKKVVGLRSKYYLGHGNAPFRVKLEELMARHGVAKEDIGRAWMTTMPSFLGLEGTNPMTNWYIYSKAKDGEEGLLKWLILEVHNSFEESCAYVLGLDSPLRQEPNKGYDLAFTLPRTFHTSPFNNRSGYYRLDILDPFPAGYSKIPNFVPKFKVFVRVLTPDKVMKLNVTLVSGPLPPARLGEGWESAWGMLKVLRKWPGTLLLVQVRTYWQAYILNYRKKLALYPRPEPGCPFTGNGFNPHPGDTGIDYGLQRKPMSSGKRGVTKAIQELMVKRAEQLGIRLEVVFEHGPQPLLAGSGDEVLSIHTADPTFFTNLMAAPSPQHFLFLMFERLTVVSNEALFIRMFGPPDQAQSDYISRWTRSIRQRYFTYLYSNSSTQPPSSIPALSTLAPHFTDSSLLSTGARRAVLQRVLKAFIVARLVERVFALVGFTFVQGQEPWLIWDRAVRRANGEVGVDVVEEDEKIGSVRLTDYI